MAPHTIAIVEDGRDSRLLLQAILGDTYAITEYENGYDALRGIACTLPDVVLLDISLPGIDGIELLGRIRADARLHRLPVVALTANTMAGDRERYLAVGFNGYVQKPIVDEADLLNAIAICISTASTGRGDQSP
jgi:CheY-like chemotaxis protein